MFQFLKALRRAPRPPPPVEPPMIKRLRDARDSHAPDWYGDLYFRISGDGAAAVEALIEALAYPEVARVAVLALSDIGDARAIPGLLRLLASADAEASVRAAAAGALGRFDTAPVRAALLVALGECGEEIVAMAAAPPLALNITIAEQRELLGMLRSPRAHARANAATAFAYVDAGPLLPEVVAALIASLADVAFEVRVRAVTALGVLGDETAAAALKAMAPPEDSVERQRFRVERQEALHLLGARRSRKS